MFIQIAQMIFMITLTSQLSFADMIASRSSCEMYFITENDQRSRDLRIKEAQAIMESVIKAKEYLNTLRFGLTTSKKFSIESMKLNMKDLSQKLNEKYQGFFMSAEQKEILRQTQVQVLAIVSHAHDTSYLLNLLEMKGGAIETFDNLIQYHLKLITESKRSYEAVDYRLRLQKQSYCNSLRTLKRKQIQQLELELGCPVCPGR
jgi:dimeric dUTPase (all-alpha-NTP-PPase superfamily)